MLKAVAQALLNIVILRNSFLLIMMGAILFYSIFSFA
jgi:hypothetical protein